MHRMKSKSGLFEIYYPLNVAAFKDPTLRLPEAIANGLEQTAALLKDLGFDYSCLSRPIPVVIVERNLMGTPTSIAEQVKINSFASRNYPMIKFNKQKVLENIKNTDILKTIGGHEFFHAVQNVYDPTWSGTGPDSTFLAEMSSVWLEYQLTSRPQRYKADVANRNAAFPNYGMIPSNFASFQDEIWKSHLVASGDTVDSVQQLGYGASTFLRYLTLRTGKKDIVFQIWKEYHDTGDALKAMKNAVANKTHSIFSHYWELFAKDYYTRFSDLSFGDRYDWPIPICNELIDLAKTKSFRKSFVSPPYSALCIDMGVRGRDKGSYKTTIRFDSAKQNIHGYLFEKTKKSNRWRQLARISKGTPYSFIVNPANRTRKRLVLVTLYGSNYPRLAGASIDIDVEKTCPEGEIMQNGKCTKPSLCPRTYDPKLDPNYDPNFPNTWHEIELASTGEYCCILCSYFSSGTLAEEKPLALKNGSRTKHGTWKHFYENGNKKREVQWHFGVRNGLDILYYQSGKIHVVTPYVNGLKHGTEKSYYEDGTLKGECSYKNGKRHGTCKDFDENGNLDGCAIYRDGRWIGPCSENR